MFHLGEDFFGNDVQVLERNVDGRKVKVEWDWARFNSTVSCPLQAAQCTSVPAFRYIPKVVVNVRGFVAPLP